MNLPVDFQLKDRNGKLLKRFEIRGPQNIDRILLWIWRDLFVSLSLTGSEKDKARIPEFLKELQEVLGLRALERLLNGGQPSQYMPLYFGILRPVSSSRIRIRLGGCGRWRIRLR